MTKTKAAKHRATVMRGLRPQQMRRRLSADFHLSLLVLFTALACVALFPFFLYRAATGNVAAAVGNGGVIVFLLLALAHAWFSGRTGGARKSVVVFIALGCIYMVAYVGHLPYWVFPTVVANFLLVSWRFGLTVNALLVAVIMIFAPGDGEIVDQLAFLTAIVLVAMFAMFFVIYTNFHRHRLNALAERDPLTDALNRRTLSTDLEEALAGAGAVGQDHALVVLDLDNFKKINDLYGHEVGDEVLVKLSKRVQQMIRRGDRFYRLGGEEFVILLSNTDRPGADVVLRKIHADLRERLEIDDRPVTVSFGVAVGQAGESWSQWLSRADHAMYQAKRDGKDRVVFAD